MHRNAQFLENGFDLVPDKVSVDGAADITGGYVNLKLYDRAYTLLTKPAGSAGDDYTITVQQAQDGSGTGVKALLFTKIWYKINADAATWTYVKLTTPVSTLDLADVNGVDLASDTNSACVMAEVVSAEMDEGFTWVRQVYSGVGTANIATTSWILAGHFYPQHIPLSPKA